jgi:hypothetical protein
MKEISSQQVIPHLVVLLMLRFKSGDKLLQTIAYTRESEVIAQRFRPPLRPATLRFGLVCVSVVAW